MFCTENSGCLKSTCKLACSDNGNVHYKCDMSFNKGESAFQVLTVILEINLSGILQLVLQNFV